jgi:Cys-Gly metallodipeptidase DUG1
MVHEPMTDLFAIFSKLVTPAGEVLVPGIADKVAPLTAEEKARYDVIDITMADFESATGAQVMLSDDKSTTLMGRMRYPSLSIHGIEGGFSGTGAKTVIPSTVHGPSRRPLLTLLPLTSHPRAQASSRSVSSPTSPPETLTPSSRPTSPCVFLIHRVRSPLTTSEQAEFAKLGSKNTLTIELLSGGMPWVEDINTPNFVAATKATQVVYGKTPDYTREGGSIPITLTLSDLLQKSVLLLPMGRGDDGAHSINEVSPVLALVLEAVLITFLRRNSIVRTISRAASCSASTCTRSRSTTERVQNWSAQESHGIRVLRLRPRINAVPSS